MSDPSTTQGPAVNLDDLTAAMEAADIYVGVSIRDGAIVLEGEVESQEIRQAALDLAEAVAEPHELGVVDAMEVMDIDVDLGDGGGSDIDSADLSPMDASTVSDVGTVDPGLAMDEAVPYFPPTDPVIGEQLIEQDEVEVIGGFQPTSDDGDADEVDTQHFDDDARISDDVRRELKEDATTTDLGNIHVSTVNGTVILRGDVPTLEDSDNAEAVAGRVPGVVEVRDELTVLTMKADRSG